jgi:3-deoxy-D-manno-octulosonic acid kinase
MLKTVQQNKHYIVFDDSLISENIERCFDAQFWHAENKVIGSATGRGTTWFIQLAKTQAALRHYHRGGLFGKLVSDHYLFTSWKNTRSIAEFTLLQTLSEQGVNVPQPIAARVQKKNFCYQADLLSEKIPNATDLVSILQQRALSEQEYRQIGLQIKKMHLAQVNHTDLNIHNILLDDNGKVWLIDFDKCYQQPTDTWKAKNMQRLLRSFNKERKKRAIQWRQENWLQLLQGYNSTTN